MDKQNLIKAWQVVSREAENGFSTLNKYDARELEQSLETIEKLVFNNIKQYD
jgi:hypothetical protein